MIVRGLALGELTWVNARKALVKELSVGFANGITTGVIAAGLAVLFKGNPMMGLLLGAAMVINLCVAAAAGTLIPLGLQGAEDRSGPGRRRCSSRRSPTWRGLPRFSA